MTQIRPAIESDIPAVVVLARRAAVAQGQRAPDRNRLLASAHRLRANAGGALYVVDDARGLSGFLAVLGVEHPLTGDLVVQIIASWLAPWAETLELERELLGHAGKFAVAIGATAVLRTVHQPTSVEPTDLIADVPWLTREVGTA